MLDRRVNFSSETERLDAEFSLEEAGLDFDYDGGDRMMISEEGIELLEDEGIDFDEL